MFKFFKRDKEPEKKLPGYEIELTASILAYEVARSDGEISKDELTVLLKEVEKIAKAYDLPYVKINNTAELRKKLTDVITASGPVVCEVMCPENQEIIPAVSAIKNDDGSMTSKPIEDMYPFLDRDEFLKEMIAEPYLK